MIEALGLMPTTPLLGGGSTECCRVVSLLYDNCKDQLRPRSWPLLVSLSRANVRGSLLGQLINEWTRPVTVYC